MTLFALHMYYNDASTKFLKDLVGSNVGLPALYFINDDATSVFENVDKSQLTRTLDKQKFALGHHIVKDKRMLADLCYPPAEDVEDHTCVLYSNKFLADIIEDKHENEDEIKASSLQVKAFIKFAKKAVLQTLFPNRRYAIVPSFKLLDVAFPKPTRSVETSSKNAASTEMDDYMVVIVKLKEGVYYRYDGSKAIPAIRKWLEQKQYSASKFIPVNFNNIPNLLAPQMFEERNNQIYADYFAPIIKYTLAAFNLLINGVRFLYEFTRILFTESNLSPVQILHLFLFHY